MNTIPQNPLLKQCSKCKQWKPATCEYFYLGRRNSDGFQYECITCRKLLKKRPPKPPKEQIKCRVCKNEFPATSEYFTKAPGVKSGIQPLCKPCATEKSRQYRKAHLEQYAEWAKVYNQRWYQEHYEYAVEQRREYRHSENGRLHARIGSLNRRARKQAAQGTYTAQDIQKQYDAQKGKCYYCGVKLGKNRREYHIDHVVPLTRGGSNAPSNLVIACPTCNLHKNDKLPHEWPQGGRLL